ncbi:TerB family tellurite resistance protein [Bernardetia sp. ABR2-2B]|uniref:tellurite resistance TerB family protein n=1 Tax=Bernardetia sp. ABR2-2B TaxID=3127472 RepID=UPI0030CE401B
MDTFEHILNSCSTEEKLSYLQLVIFIAFSDHHLSDDEVVFLERITQIANLSEEQQQLLASYSRHPANIDIQLCTQNIARSPLREILLIDLMVIARSDDEVATEERSAITQIAVLLGVPLDEVIRLTNSVNKFSNSEGKAPQEWINQSMISILYKDKTPTKSKKLSMMEKMKKFLGVLKK